MSAIAAPPASLAMILRALKLPTVARHADEIAHQAERAGWTFGHYLHHLVELEMHERRRGRIARHLKASGLPAEKTLATLTRARLPAKVAATLPALCEGGFVERGDNLLAFGLPGRGKTHLVCAIGHELIHRGYRVFFTATYALVQRLLAAKRDLRLEKELAVLDGFDAVVLDDIGYVQQSRDEMEVLFTFLAERYERRSVIITSNLVFSEWDRIFKDPMTTAAAIDRLVHHAVIIEMTGTSIRAEHAHTKRTSQGAPSPITTETTTTPAREQSDRTGGSSPTTTTTTDRASTGAPTPTTTTPTPTTTTPTTTTPTPKTTTPTPTTTTPTRAIKAGGLPTETPTTRSKSRDHSTNAPDGEM
jgi:DNA replication protein DnaC